MMLVDGGYWILDTGYLRGGEWFDTDFLIWFIYGMYGLDRLLRSMTKSINTICSVETMTGVVRILLLSSVLALKPDSAELTSPLLLRLSVLILYSTVL